MLSRKRLRQMNSSASREAWITYPLTYLNPLAVSVRATQLTLLTELWGGAAKRVSLSSQESVFGGDQVHLCCLQKRCLACTHTHTCTHTDLQIGSAKPDINSFASSSSVTPMLGLQWLSESIHQVSEIILDMESQEEDSQKVHKQNSPPVLADRPLLHRNGPPRERYLVESCQQSLAGELLGFWVGFLAASPAISNLRMQPCLKSFANCFLSVTLQNT